MVAKEGIIIGVTKVLKPNLPNKHTLLLDNCLVNKTLLKHILIKHIPGNSTSGYLKATYIIIITHTRTLIKSMHTADPVDFKNNYVRVGV